MTHKYHKLRTRIYELGMDIQDLAAKIGKGKQWLYNRLCGNVPWAVNDVALVAPAINIPLEKAFEYFYEN